MKQRMGLILVIIFLISLFLVSSVLSQSSVGLEVGDWAEYDGILRQNGSEDTTKIKIEVITVNKKITLKQTFTDSDGSTTIETISGELGKDSFSGWIIPSNLNIGDTFTENEMVRTIIGTEERVCLGEKRQLVYADILEMEGMQVFWDKKTGIAVEAIRELGTTYSNTRLVSTNIWESKNFGFDTTVLNLVIVIVSLILVLIGVLVYRKNTHNKKIREQS